ncbi:ABC transporter substrate-binding protein [Parachitinimonas caeni]|uniref:ABC transporter substrate-binding protein n=1 Tax=Parachitinimonas caeni TaxID=3031301 RepID=A0ABT7DZR0_9NEIS|nr:ABC transporter substrate-binding protein [Parachitinimonas caeni]MDK2125554.1 ABC transporter substrate-binding protein [Parachitinimonas caeni]
MSLSFHVAASDNAIQVLQVLDLSGPNGDTGRDFSTGAKVYLDAINAKGGIHGRLVNLVLADDQGDASRTVALTRKLSAQYRPAALFGYMGADNVKAVVAQSAGSAAQLPMVAPYVGIDIAPQDDAPVYYLRAGSDDEIRKIVRIAQSSGLRRIALVAGNDTLGKATVEGIRNGLSESSGTQVTNITLLPNSTEVGKEARLVAQSNPDAVILAAPTLTSAAFVRACQALRPGTQFFALSWINPQTLAEFVGSQNVRWVAISALVPSPYNPVTPVARDFVQTLAKYRDEAPNYASFEGYLSAKMLVEALKKARDGNSTALKLALDNTNLDLGGMQLRMAPGNRRASRYVEMGVFSNAGRLVN